MKSIALNSVQKMAVYLYRKPRIQSIYRSILGSLVQQVMRESEYPEFSRFTTETGVELKLRSGVRDDVKPSWRLMVSSKPEQTIPTDADIVNKANACRESVNQAVLLLNTLGMPVRGKKALEIGCYDGIHAHYIANHTLEKVVASDISAYYIVQSSALGVTDDSLNTQAGTLEALRNNAKKVLQAHEGKSANIEFIEDNIVDTVQVGELYDFIFSWEVLEHVVDPQRALVNMYKLLSEGGVCFHEYNPFFCISGGHSLCTLDILWGHARLSGKDFDRYVETLRPDEASVDKNFFHQSLNRMTLQQLRDYATAAGFTVETTIPFVNEHHVSLLSDEILHQVIEQHSTATVLDLVAPKVWLVLRKA